MVGLLVGLLLVVVCGLGEVEGFDKLPNGDGSFSATGNAGSLRRAVFEWIAGGGTYGPIEDWDVSEVTNMKYVFTGYQTASTFGSFNADLSKWNMAAVTNMEASKCTTLSPSQWPRRLPLWCVVEYIRKLDVRRVTILTRIVIFVVFLKRYTLFCCLWWVGLSFLCGTLSLVVFESAFAFNSDVSKWNTGAVTRMDYSKCTRSFPLCGHAFRCCVFEYTTTRVSSDHNSHPFCYFGILLFGFL